MADDDANMLRLISRILESTSCVVLTARGGLEALALVQMHAPDAVLLDRMMPDMSGVDVLRRLRQEETTRHLPVAFVTGYVDSSFVREVMGDLQTADILVKPFRTDELLRLLEGIWLRQNAATAR